MKQTAISIIIPVYNAENYLRRCIDSVLSQSFTEFELILVDDGSKDKSPQICDEYASQDTRVRVIHKANGGVSAARNDGLDIAKGEYVTFIDSDDWVEREYLETLSNYRNYDIVFFSHRMIYEDSYAAEFVFEEKTGNDNDIWSVVSSLKSNATNKNFYGYTWNKMFRRFIIEEFNIRFVEELRVSEDEVYTLDYCTHANSIKVLPVCLYNYRVLGTGLTATRNSAAEYAKLANSYLAILNREKNDQIDDVYIPDVIVRFYTASMEQDNPLYACSMLRQMKSILKKRFMVKVQPLKIQFFVKLPIFVELIWWCCYRMRMNIVKTLKK